MQLMKGFSGALSSTATVTRHYCHGSTTTTSVSGELTDILNQSIANFLTDECGVTAQYEQRDGDSYKFLYIYDLPFFYAVTTQGYVTCYSPIYTNEPAASQFTNFFTGNTYSFTLYFTGTPNAFVLRIAGYQKTINPGCDYQLRIAKATNMLNGKTSVLWFRSYPQSAQSFMYAYGFDINEDGTYDKDSLAPRGTGNQQYQPEYNYYNPFLQVCTGCVAVNPNKIPFVPAIIGPWVTKDLYLRPTNVTLPNATLLSTEAQTEVEIDGRRFIVLVSNNPSNTGSQEACIGVIEVTDN